MTTEAPTTHQPHDELHKEMLAVLHALATLPLSAPVAQVSDLRKRAAAAIARVFPERAEGVPVQWRERKPVMLRLPICPDFVDDRMLSGVSTSLTLREDFATMDLGDGRKLQVCRGVVSPHLFVEWPRDDPKHPGLRIGLDCSDVLSPLVQYAEGRPAGAFAPVPIRAARDDVARYDKPATPAAKDA